MILRNIIGVQFVLKDIIIPVRDFILSPYVQKVEDAYLVPLSMEKWF
jgi:hypothetical protein